MIELTVMELVLLLSNIVSWWLYFKTENQRDSAERVAKMLIENEELRNRVVKEYQEFVAKRKA